MEVNLMNWLNMVWSALEEEDAEKRLHLLHDANSFLEQVRQHSPEPALELAGVSR